MESPFRRKFETWQIAKAALDATGHANGYSWAFKEKLPSRMPEDRLTKVVLRCSRGRKAKIIKAPGVAEKDRREGGTQMCACPYRITITLGDDDLWSVSRGPRPHNHDPAKSSAVFSRNRRQALENRLDDIVRRWNDGNRPGKILSSWRNSEPNLPEDIKYATQQDIRNVLNRYQASVLSGRSELQWLYDELYQTGDYVCYDRRDDEDRLKALFIAPKSGIELFRRYPHVMLFDCTYKTNRFNMPLFNACGATPNRKTFQIFAVFMSGETKEDYDWALSQFERLLCDNSIDQRPRVTITDRDLALIKALNTNRLFHPLPHILCRWHINKNVLAKTKRHFPPGLRNADGRVMRAPEFTAFIKDWNSLVRSPTKEEFKENLQKLQGGRHPAAAVTYATNTWIVPWKEKFVVCFIDQHRHFGHTTTSIIESLHATMKRTVWSSTGDLSTVFRGLHRFWVDQEASVATADINATGKVPTATFQRLYELIREHVTPSAMKLMLKEQRSLDKDLSKSPPGPCHCSLFTAYGIPCRHVIHTTLCIKGCIELEEIDPYWRQARRRLDVDDHEQGSQVIAPYEPLTKKSKGRPRDDGPPGRAKKTKRRQTTADLLAQIESDETVRHMQPPPSTAPAALTMTMTKNSTTDMGLLRLEQKPDTYEPGTEMPRASHRSITALEDDPDDVELEEIPAWVDDEGDVDAELENAMDEASDDAESAVAALRSESLIRDCIVVAT
ncbi:MULE transposase [Hirsutella rhossiliensis]|uniref:MULE transposase domain-containing protein n=1 Tax=Hirsutella rhossiliensis TaxID=111463 RepID=A0A9P8MSL9_9HYPO|nr:MULE transposase domain-containing protein [Hirsutella rhossiliensis]KAH0960414.1 MULE transposase domain-containing protein [Hirsutella rhossiliensis]